MLTTFERQDNLVKRLMQKCDNDIRYSITIVAKNIFNISDTKSHDFSINYFVNGKKKGGYGLIDIIYEKYEKDKRFKCISASDNHCTMQYQPNYK